jgi:carbonic anhydrase/acetyltransferase-like protein (isoleucine patch superfamily)
MSMASDDRPTIVLPYGGERPSFSAPPVFCGSRSAVLGRATLGEQFVIGARATLRADGNFIRAGDAFCLGTRSTVHISRRHPTLIGQRVAVGANAVIHACEIGDDVTVEDDVVILDGATVESNTLITKGSIVFPRARLESGGVWTGLPARRVRSPEPGEIEAAAQRIKMESSKAPAPRPSGVSGPARLEECRFAAPTARIAGAVAAAEDSSLWFGCEIDAEASTITIGARSNVQDNSEISCPSGPVAIGPDSVIGHNVRLESCTIGTRTLIGNGAFVQRGAIVEDRVLLAAGAVTEPGQRLESGWVWGGRPARRLSELAAERLRQTESTVAHYIAYAADFRAVIGT